MSSEGFDNEKKECIEDQITTMLEKVLKDDNEEDYNANAKTLYTINTTCEKEELLSFFEEENIRLEKKSMTQKEQDTQNEKFNKLLNRQCDQDVEDIFSPKTNKERAARHKNKFNTVTLGHSPMKPNQEFYENFDSNFINYDLQNQIGSVNLSTFMNNGRYLIK